jgi:hypothetical protein
MFVLQQNDVYVYVYVYVYDDSKDIWRLFLD